MTHTDSKKCEINGESDSWKDTRWLIVHNISVSSECFRGKLWILDQPFRIFISFRSVSHTCLHSFSLPSPSSHAFPYPKNVWLHSVTVDSSCLLVSYKLRPLCSLCLPLLYTEPDRACSVLCNQFSLNFLTAPKLMSKFQFYGSVHLISINENTNWMRQS